jgi:hypothetical protein
VRTSVVRLDLRFADLRDNSRSIGDKQNSRFLKVLIYVLGTTPASFSTLIEDVFGAIVQVLKMESRDGWPQTRDLVQQLPRIFQPSGMYPDTLVAYGHVLYLLLERIKTMKDAPGWQEIFKEFRTYAGKFSLSLLHCPRVPLKETLLHVRGIQAFRR